jgi:hypothetical protein
MISDSESSDIEYESDSDYCYDLSKQNTGTDRFITSEIKFINFKDYPHIYDPFYPHINLIESNDIMNIILNFIVKDNTYTGLLSLRKTNYSYKDLIDFYMKSQGKKFCEHIVNKYEIKIKKCIECNKLNIHSNSRIRRYRKLHNKWLGFVLHLLNK